MIQDKVSQRESIHSVFSYGTLTQKFPLHIEYEAQLVGCYDLDVMGMYPELRKGIREEVINGHILHLSDDDLKEADRYESSLYKREILTLQTEFGDLDAWVYLAV